jgi:hypothetical protein
LTFGFIFSKDFFVPLPSQTLSALQVAGAAIHAADAELKTTVQELADRVKIAMLDNPFDLGNDGMFEAWKTLARMSQAVAQVETEFKRIYEAAANISAPVPARAGSSAKRKLAAPKKAVASDEALEVLTEIQATDAVVKKAPNKRKSAAAKKKAQRPLGGNTARVWTRLQEILNTKEFVKMNRSAEAAVIGLPKGSIGASIAKLIENGQLLEDASGSFKLVSPKLAAE